MKEDISCFAAASVSCSVRMSAEPRWYAIRASRSVCSSHSFGAPFPRLPCTAGIAARVHHFTHALCIGCQGCRRARKGERESHVAHSRGRGPHRWQIVCACSCWSLWSVGHRRWATGQPGQPDHEPWFPLQAGGPLPAPMYGWKRIPWALWRCQPTSALPACKPGPASGPPMRSIRRRRRRPPPPLPAPGGRRLLLPVCITRAGTGAPRRSAPCRTSRSAGCASACPSRLCAPLAC